MAPFSAHREDHLKKNCPKRTFPSDFVKLVPEILYLFLAEKRSFVFFVLLFFFFFFLFVCFVCFVSLFCLFCFVCFVAICPIMAYFFLN